MLSELFQEIIKLKQDHAVKRNLILAIITAIACGCFLAEVNKQPTRLAKQEKIAQFSHKASAGMIIKTYQFFPR